MSEAKFEGKEEIEATSLRRASSTDADGKEDVVKPVLVKAQTDPVRESKIGDENLCQMCGSSRPPLNGKDPCPKCMLLLKYIFSNFSMLLSTWPY